MNLPFGHLAGLAPGMTATQVARVNETFNHAFDACVREVARRHAEETNRWLHGQLDAVISGLLKSGDLRQLIASDGRRALEYVPFRDLERKNRIIRKLQDELDGCRKAIRDALEHVDIAEATDGVCGETRDYLRKILGPLAPEAHSQGTPNKEATVEP